MANKFDKHLRAGASNTVQLVQLYQVGVDRGGRVSAFADSTAASLNIYLKPDSSVECEFKMTFSADSTSTATIVLYESPTITADGTLIVQQNKRRNVQGVYTCPHLCYKDATVTANGTQIAKKKFTGGTGPGGNSTAGSQISSDEFIIDNTKTYLLVVTSTDGIKGLSAQMSMSGSTYFNE